MILMGPFQLRVFFDSMKTSIVKYVAVHYLTAIVPSYRAQQELIYF